MPWKKLTAFVLVSLLLSSGTALCQEGLLRVVINDFSGGMNSNSLADILQPNQGASMVNVVTSQPGKLFKRKGQGLLAEDVGSTAFTGIGRFDPDKNTAYVVAASEVDVVRATLGASSWTVINSASPLTTGKDTEFVQANDLLFILNGFDNTAWYNGNTWIEAGSYPSSPPTAAYGLWLRNYLFLAGNPENEDWIYFSNNLEPHIFSANDILKVNTGDGQVIQAIEPFRLNEIVIYKERSIFVLDITGTTPLTDWTVQPISNSVGLAAPRAVVNLGNDQWFLSSDPIAIRSLARTQFDKILLGFVSQPIQDIFDGTGDVTLNKAQIEKAAAVLFDNKFLLAFPTGTSLVNNTVAVYDFVTNSWSLISGWFPADWIVQGNKLFYADANDGRVIECFVESEGDWLQGPNTITFASTPTAAIQSVYMSPIVNFDRPDVFKMPDAVEVEFEPTGDYTADVYINLDNSGWQNIGTINLAGTGSTLPITLPNVLSNTGLARKTFQIQNYGEFKKIQIMIRQSGVNQKMILHRIQLFARPKPWRRE